MAVFDLLSPVFTGFDDLVEPFTNDFIRITFWALVSALLTSIVFKKLSNPEKITSLKVQLKAKQKELNDHDGEFSELKGLAVDTMKLSMKRMGLTFLPAMLASVPIIFVLTYLSNRYELIEPVAEETVPINIVWENPENPTNLSIQKDGVSLKYGKVDSIDWPVAGQTIQLLESNNTVITFPIPISSVIHKKQWWNSLIGNPAGYLNTESSLNRIEFKFKKQEIINFGPSWMHGWLFVFFFMTFAFSIVFLFVFKIKF